MTKTILIMGSTDGIGKHLALKLASEGHEIILHGRSGVYKCFYSKSEQDDVSE